MFRERVCQDKHCCNTGERVNDAHSSFTDALLDMYWLYFRRTEDVHWELRFRIARAFDVVSYMYLVFSDINDNSPLEL